jgi:regulator of RNase E activity RraA
VNVPVAVGGVAITPGDWVIADDDGVVVIPQAEVESVLAAAEAKREKEAGQMRDIRAGLVD